MTTQDPLATLLCIPYADAPDAADCALCGEPVRMDTVEAFVAALRAAGVNLAAPPAIDPERLAHYVAAVGYVLQLANQTGFDDDEWEQAITDLEAEHAAIRAAYEATDA